MLKYGLLIALTQRPGLVQLLVYSMIPLRCAPPVAVTWVGAVASLFYCSLALRRLPWLWPGLVQLLYYAMILLRCAPAVAVA